MGVDGRVGLAVGSYFLVSCSTTLYNKWLYDFSLQGSGFHFPALVVLCQMALAYIYSRVCLLFWVEANLDVSWAEIMYRFTPIGICVVLDIVLTNEAIDMMDVSFVMTVKSSSPVFVLLLSFFFTPDPLPCILVLSVLLVSLGTGMVVYGKGDVVVWYGCLLVLLAALCAGMRSVLSQIILHGNLARPLNPIMMVRCLSPIACVMLIIPVAVFDIPALVAWLQQAETAEISKTAGFVAIGSMLAFSLNLVEYYIISLTSALTMSIAGIFKTVGLVGLGSLLFHEALSRTQCLGFVVSLCGLAVYNYTKHSNAGKQDSESLEHVAANQRAPLVVDGSSTKDEIDKEAQPLLAS